MAEIFSILHTLKFVSAMSTETTLADDATLISTIFEKLKTSRNEVKASCKKWGMNISPDKYTIISDDADSIQINDRKVE